MSTTIPADYDVFLSYAHADNKTSWVQSVYELLEIKVSEKLGRQARIFFDPQMEIGDRVTKKLVESVKSSGILLIILSPSYLASEWCKRELDQFLAHRKSTERNIFVIEADKVPREEWPAELADLETREMWDTAGALPLRLDPTLPEYQPRFTRSLYEIAYAVGKRLEMFEPTLPEPPKGSVWIAPVTDELLQQRKELAEMVRQAGWTVLPATQYKRDESKAFEEALEKDLAEASLLIQLLGPLSGDNPVWSSSPFPVLHANAARAVAKKRKVRWLRWRHPDAKSTTGAADYAALVHEGEIQEGTAGEFAVEVNRCLKVLLDPPGPGPNGNGGHPKEAVMVYIHNDVIDDDLRRSIEESLLTIKNVDILPPTPAPSEAELPGDQRDKQLAAVLNSDGVILVHGKKGAFWVQSQYPDIRKALLRSRQPNGLIGVCKAPPPPPKPDVVRSRSVLPIDCSEGIKPELLADFIERLRELPREEGDDA